MNTRKALLLFSVDAAELTLFQTMSTAIFLFCRDDGFKIKNGNGSGSDRVESPCTQNRNPKSKPEPETDSGGNPSPKPNPWIPETHG